MLLAGHDIRLVAAAQRLLAVQAGEIPQKDEVCGAFQVTLALRAAGVDVDQDAVAEAAGTVLSAGGSRELLPAGETGRDDFRLRLPMTEDASRAGTAPAGLVRAVGELTDGTRAAVPLHGAWTAEAVSAMLEAAIAEPDAAVVANVATRWFWGARPSVAQLVAHLEDGADDGPPPDWDVGHYVGLLGLVRGRAGALAVVADSYRGLGLDGVYAQPLGRLAPALVREGMTPGGLLLVVPAERAAAMEAAGVAAGLEVGPWDNGSPDARGG